MTGTESIKREEKLGVRKRCWRDFGLPKRLPASPAPPKLPPAEDSETAHRQILAALSVGDGQAPSFVRDDGHRDRDFGLVPTPEGLDDVLVTKSFVDHIAQHTARAQFAEFVLPTLRNPAEVWLQARQGERSRVFLAAYDDDHDGIVVVREDKYGWLAWTFYPHRAINAKRKGQLLYRREE